MPVKSRGSTVMVEPKRSTRKPKRQIIAVPNLDAERNPGVTEMLKQIKVRGDQLSAEIKQLLVRLG